MKGAFVIESKQEKYHAGVQLLYGYRSLINGSVGTWCDSSEEAEEQGKRHTELMEKIHNCKLQ